jgi:hypothetical protein
MDGFINLILGIILAFTVVVFITQTRSGLPPRFHPIHKGIAPQAQQLVNEYRILAAEHHINFAHNVTIGFVDIKVDNIIGVCYSRPDFREIDIDSSFWDKRASQLRQKALLFHELTHCFCGREHDYGDGKPYIGSEEKPTKAGYMQDGCPLSIMHPIVIDDYCMQLHYSYYIDEMFARCAPW